MNRMNGFQVMVSFCLFFVIFTQCKDNTESNGNSSSMNFEKEGKVMGPRVSIVEIPMTDVSRAIRFYESVFQIKLERMTMGDTELGVFPSKENTASIVLTKGKDYKPKSNGVLVYLNASEDLQPTLDLVVAKGGTILLPKTEISPEMGYFALFLDTEGNRIGLHSNR